MEHAIMAFKRFDQPFEISRHEAVPLPQVRGAILRCLRGTLWITQEGDREDHFVHAGEGYTVNRDGVTLVTAPRGPSTLFVTRPRPQREGLLTRGALRWRRFAS
jgi:hypothetical protein